jgi:hypothetical protein
MTESPIETHMRLMSHCPEYQSRIQIYDDKFEEIKNHFKRTGRYSILLCYDVVTSRIEELESGIAERCPNELYELKRFIDYLDL